FFDVFVDIDMGSNKITNLANGTVSGDALHFGQIGTQIQAWDTDLDGLAAVSSTGLIARTASGMFSPRTIMGTASRVTVVNGDGVAGNPTLNVAEAGIDHNLLLNYVANEHINHTSVTLTAGVGLNGGGDITVSRTFNVDAVKGTAAVTFGAIADGAVGDSTNTITATGAVIGDPVALGLPATVPAGFTYNAFVSAANTVMVRAANNGGGTGAGDANATMNVIVFQYAGF
ncbi:MAG: hypothetical protein ACREAU_05080, partial [Nitrosopumilaceae archaeon]